MSLQNTNLLIQMAPLPATFSGTPGALAAEMIRRMRIVSPTGTNFIFIGDVEPTSNVGPWLKGGTQWYVFDEDTKRYVPLDISASEKTWYFIGASTPTDVDPPLWLRTTHTPTEADPSFGSPISWYQWNGAAWVPFNSIVFSGPTANRPSNPIAFQQFYDTDINALIWFERNQWRTVDGIPGDVKAVSFETLADALVANPGWELFGESNQAFRGRYIMEAAANFDGSDPVTVNPGVGQRNAFETFGETDGVQIDASSVVPYPPSIALWHLVKT